MLVVIKLIGFGNCWKGAVVVDQFDRIVHYEPALLEPAMTQIKSLVRVD